LFDQPEVGLVDERRGLQRVSIPLATKLAGRDSTQLGINEGQKGFQGATIAAAPAIEQARDVRIWGHRQS
jgi:hypothetical protein